MKNIITVIVIICLALNANAQLANFKSSGESKNFVYWNLAYDFGLTNQVGYAYKLNTNKAIYIHSDISVPMGKVLLDDFKYGLGGQMLLLERNQFLISTKMDVIFRRHETKLVRLANLGVELGGAVGIYKPNWHLALELNYDYALLTNIKHSESMIQNYPAINDGWYSRSGGNFSYGIQTSRSLGGAMDLNLSFGKVASRFNDVNPLLPFYGQIGLVWKLKSKAI